MKILNRNKESGFTLVEMLVVMVVVSILSLLMANFITIWLGQSSLSQAQTALLNNAELALDKITTDIKLSGSVDVNNRWADDNGPGGNDYGWTSGSQVLVLAKAATDKNGNILFDDPVKYISEKDNEIYFLTGTTLYRRTLTSDNPSDAAVTTCPPAEATKTCPVDNTIATGVSSLSFTYYDSNENIVTPSNAHSVQVSITLSSYQGGKKATASYTTRMVFRNE